MGFNLILLWIVVAPDRAGYEGKIVDPLVGPVILPIAVLMVLAPLPAAAVNARQAFACHDPRLNAAAAQLDHIVWHGQLIRLPPSASSSRRAPSRSCRPGATDRSGHRRFDPSSVLMEGTGRVHRHVELRGPMDAAMALPAG